MNDGFVNEEELREYINSNTYSEYNNNIKTFLKFVFNGNINEFGNFVATKIGGQVKPDMSITHQGITKNISIKKGSGNSVHQEKIDVFFPYVESKCGTEVLKCLKLFHYGDGTYDDSGTTRYSGSECQTIYAKEIKILNNSFNSWDILKAFLDRFLFKGNINVDLVVDVVYHGTINKGIWASRNEIYDYFKSKNFESNAIHFGSLTYQVWGRNNDFVAVHPDRRYVMQVKWGSIMNDLLAIRR